MPTARSRLGARGEEIAAAHLTAQGLAIAARNYRTRHGEIDLVARDGEMVVFVEVKTRRGAAYGTPEESVTARKRGRLARTAMAYLQEHGLEGRPWRLDVIAITLSQNGPATINHVRSIAADAG